LLAGFLLFLAVLYVGLLVVVLTRRSRRASVKAFRLFFASFLLLVIAFPLVLAFPPAVVALPLVPLAALGLLSQSGEPPEVPAVVKGLGRLPKHLYASLHEPQRKSILDVVFNQNFQG